MFYILHHSKDLKIVGQYFQSEKITNYMGDNPHHLNNIYFERIDFDPIVAIPVLTKKAKITDLVSNVNGGGNFHLIMQKRLMEIIIKYRTEGLQFFKTSIVKDGVKYDDYFSINMFKDDNDVIDFDKTIIRYRKYDPEIIHGDRLIQVDSLLSFESLLERRNMFDEISFERIYVLENVCEDFFMIKHPVRYIVSETLKKEIEDAGCTGIEFQPVELSYNEWTAPGGEREKIYGAV